jgi:hypothetical protein
MFPSENQQYEKLRRIREYPIRCIQSACTDSAKARASGGDAAPRTRRIEAEQMLVPRMASASMPCIDKMFS